MHEIIRYAAETEMKQTLEQMGMPTTITMPWDYHLLERWWWAQANARIRGAIQIRCLGEGSVNSCATNENDACGGWVVLRRIKRGNDDYSYQFARLPFAQHLCARHSVQYVPSGHVLSPEDILEGKSPKFDFSRVFVKAQGGIRPTGLTMFDHPRPGFPVKQPRRLCSRNSWLGFLRALSDAAGLGRFDPNAHLWSFLGIPEKLADYCSANKGRMGAWADKLVIPDGVADFLDQLEGALEARTRRPSLDRKAVVVGLIYRVENERGAMEICLSHCGSGRIIATEQLWASLVDSFGEVHLPRADRQHGQETLFIGLVEKNSCGEIVLLDAAWNVVDREGCLGRSAYELDAYAQLQSAGLKFIAYQYLQVRVGGVCVQIDIIVVSPAGLIYVEVDPHGSRGKRRKRNRNRKYLADGNEPICYDRTRSGPGLAQLVQAEIDKRNSLGRATGASS